MRAFISCIILFLTTYIAQSQKQNFHTQLDSIQKLRQLSRNEGLDLDTRLKYANLASKLSYKTEVDSTILKSNRGLLTISLRSDNDSIITKVSHLNIKLAKKLKDTIVLTRAYAALASAYFSQFTKQFDSAYYYNNMALNLSYQCNDIETTTFSLYYLSVLQSNIKDYIGSNSSAIKAIKIIDKHPDSFVYKNFLWNLYNKIGLNLKHIKEYNKAIEYFDKAIEMANKYNTLEFYETYLHININKAELYKEIGEYDKVFDIYNTLLIDKDLKEKDPLTYAAIINNLAYTKFLSGNKDYNTIEKLFNEAYSISDDLQAIYELAAGGNDMADYYLATNKKDKALYYAERALVFAKKAKENDEVLRALLTLSKLKLGSEGKQYLYEHIKLNDSLIDLERSNRNKFARISYETDQLVSQNKKLTSQNTLIFGIGAIAVTFLILLYTLKWQHAKNKSLLFEKNQESSNQEIYKLMLDNQIKLEEGRTIERHRISEDLHDGILSKLFGTRINLEFLSSELGINNNSNFKKYITEVQGIEKEIRIVSHTLKEFELKENLDFISLIKDYLQNQCEPNHIDHALKIDPNINWKNIDGSTKVHLYRIIQEAVVNTIKHAKAKTININFYSNENSLILDIKDDGNGFNTKKNYRGIGLKNIASRVSKINGNLNIISTPNKGTLLRIKNKL